MDVLQSLGAEHRLIGRVLDAFEDYVRKVEAKEPLDRERLQKFTDFFENFAHLHHHDKEEALLLPALARAGLDWNGEPLARIRVEHDQEQYLMRSLRHLAQQTDAWAEDDRLHFLNVATTFLQFHRQHMDFENTHVYPHVSALAELERTRLSREVTRFDDEAQASLLRATELGYDLAGSLKNCATR